MTPSRPDKSLIARFLAMTNAERVVYLQRACVDDPTLEERLPKIMEAFAAGGAPAVARRDDDNIRALQDALNAGSQEQPGNRIGHYKLLQAIGEGGFGIVWMAEQEEPIRRRVALKIIKVGMDTREVIARFEVERQALALMDHPNIARVLDAGATASGRPYFAMELVHGVPITRYCDENRLNADARLRLFIPICHAVQHAHQKGVIHRDLKPSNILVTLHDGVPVPKVIDFGIAKATSGARLTDKTLFTQFHAFMGTPAYSSPEQMEMSELDVDTRSDIYALGVLLYELLAGRTPFDPEALAKAGLEAMRRTIREVEPPRPSARLRTLSDADRTRVARQRATDAVKLTSLLRGDLDWIAMRCLEKDRTRRYEAASALAADVERHLKHEPIAARPPGGVYRARKFVRRHRFGVAAAAAVAVSLLAGLIASSVLLVREHAARSRAIASERAEAGLRQQADEARTAEALRASRTARELAERLLAEGRSAEGIAFLVHAARKNPGDMTIAPHLASVLTTRNFLFPVGARVQFPSRISNVQFVDGGQKIAVYCDDGTVGFIDRATGNQMRTRLPAGLVSPGVVFNGAVTVVRGADNVLRVLEPTTGRIEREFALGRRIGRVSVVRPEDPLVFALSADGTMTVAEIGTGRMQSFPLALPPTSNGPQPRLLVAAPSPDGRWLATMFADVTEGQLWNVEAAKYHGAHRFTGDVKTGGFSPDSRTMAVVSKTGPAELSLALLSVPDLRDKITPRVLPITNTNADFLLTYSHDSRFLSVASQLWQRVFDAETGEPVSAALATGFTPAAIRSVIEKRHTELGAGVTRGCVFLRSPEHPRFITSSGFDARPELTLRDVATGNGVLPALHHPSGVWPGVVSDDESTLLAVSGDRHVMLWDLCTGELRAQPAVQVGTVESDVALSPDGNEIVVGGEDGVVQRFQTSRTVSRPLVLPRAPPYMPAPFLPEKPARLVWLGTDHAEIIDVRSGRTTQKIAFPEPILGLSSGGRGIAIRPDLAWMAVQPATGGWQAWELGRGKIQRVVRLADAPAGTGWVCFSAAGDRVAMIPSGQPLTARLWDLATGRSLGPPLVHTSGIYMNNVQPACFSRDGRRFIAGSLGGIVRIWDCVTGAIVTEWAVPHDAAVTFVAASADDTLVATDNAFGEVQLWAAATGQPATPVLADSRGAAGMGFSNTGDLLVTWGLARALVWDVQGGKPVGDAMEHRGSGIRWAAFSGDGRRVVTGAQDCTARVWDTRTGRPLSEPLPHATRVVNCQFSPDGEFIRTEQAGGPNAPTLFLLWSVPPDVRDAPAPEWLLQLATICARKTINDAGKCVDAREDLMRIDEVRSQLAALPDNAPFADWGRWILDERPERPIAPGFTITPEEGDALAHDLAAGNLGAEKKGP